MKINFANECSDNSGLLNGGEAGIRTLGGVAPTTIFETVPFNRSGTSPYFDRNSQLGYHIHHVRAKYLLKTPSVLKA